MTGICQRYFKKWGRTPGELFGLMTPSQFVGLFAGIAGSGFDRIEELIRHNDERGRKGLRPVIPTWLKEG